LQTNIVVVIVINIVVEAATAEGAAARADHFPASAAHVRLVYRREL
jgi:hypothetical protein